MQEFALYISQCFVAGLAIGMVGLTFCGISQSWFKMIGKKNKLTTV